CLQAEDGIRDDLVTGVQTCALPILPLPEDRPRLDALKGEIAAARERTGARRQAARGDFDRWLASADAKAMTANVPADGLRFHARSEERRVGKGGVYERAA